MNSIKAISAGLIALAALLPVSAPAANIGVYAILKNRPGADRCCRSNPAAN
jgi:hypothetical protein